MKLTPIIRNVVDSAIRDRVCPMLIRLAILMSEMFLNSCSGLFRKESKIDAFVNLRVTLSLAGEIGIIEGQT